MRSWTGTGTGFPSPSFDVIGVASTIIDYAGNLYNYAMESYFGRVNLSWKDRYVLTGTLRTDGSSKFARDYRWGWFPSVSDVPEKAVTMLPRAIMSVGHIITACPHTVKAEAVIKAITAPVSERIPSTILKTHPDWQLFLDRDSASLLLSI